MNSDIKEILKELVRNDGNIISDGYSCNSCGKKLYHSENCIVRKAQKILNEEERIRKENEQREIDVKRAKEEIEQRKYEFDVRFGFSRKQRDVYMPYDVYDGGLDVL